MADNAAPAKPPAPKPGDNPTQVKEPSPMRPPNEPVPQNPQKPQEIDAGDEDLRPETQGE